MDIFCQSKISFSILFLCIRKEIKIIYSLKMIIDSVDSYSLSLSLFIYLRQRRTPQQYMLEIILVFLK